MPVTFTIEKGGVHDLSDSPTSLSAGTDFWVQNRSFVPLYISEGTADPTNDDGAEVVGGVTWYWQMPAAGTNCYLFAPGGAKVTVGETP